MLAWFSCAFSPPGTAPLILQIYTLQVCIWDTATLNQVLVYNGHQKRRTRSCGIRACTFSHDSNLVASGGDEMIIRIWSRDTGLDKIVISCESELIPWCLRFSADDKRLLAVGGLSQAVFLWDLESKAKLATLNGHERICQYAEFSPSGKYIISC